MDRGIIVVEDCFIVTNDWRINIMPRSTTIIEGEQTTPLKEMMQPGHAASLIRYLSGGTSREGVLKTGERPSPLVTGGLNQRMTD